MANQSPPSPLESEPAFPRLMPTGALTKLRVIKLLPFGIAGELPDGSQGLVREREISWRPAKDGDWRKRFVVGEVYPVMVLTQRQEYYELSLRLIEADPWKTVAAKYPVGHLVNGRVASYVKDAIFVELEPAVTARLHQSHLPAWAQTPIEEIFWTGDYVKGVVQQVNLETREIELSVERVNAYRWRQERLPTPEQGAPSPPVYSATHTMPAAATLVAESLEALGKRSLLVIEDDPQQNQALQRWLKNAGQHVQGVSNAEDGLLCVQEQRFDFILCDVGLPDKDGITAVREILQQETGARCILMTDWATADHRQREIALLEEQGVTLLVKPILPEELAVVLQTIDTAMTRERQHKMGQQRQRLITPEMLTTHRSAKKELALVLRNLRSQTRATKVTLFQFDPRSRTVQIVGQSGPSRLDPEALTKLVYSPVRDVAEDEVTIHIDDVEQAGGYVRYLRPLLRFRSCVGTPVPANLQQRYALFLFHHEPGFTGGVIEQDAVATAAVISAVLEKQAFLEQAAEMQRTVLLGHLSRALIHETNHQLSPILFALSDLQHQCQQAQQALTQGISQVTQALHEAEAMLQELNASVQKLVKTTRLFARVTVQDQEDAVNVERTVEQCIDLIHDLAERAHVRVHLHRPNALLMTQAKLTQVHQVILNLLLNAIQQIQIIRPREGGNVHLAITLIHTANSVDVIRVTVEDDGPGIHQRLWERIFDLGMTTRQGEGSGLGLFIAQRLIENAGGRLYVAESAPLWGTRMVAEFPVYGAEERGTTR